MDVAAVAMAVKRLKRSRYIRLLSTEKRGATAPYAVKTLHIGHRRHFPRARPNRRHITAVCTNSTTEMDVAARAMAVKRLIDPATYVSSHVSTEKRSHRTIQ